MLRNKKYLVILALTFLVCLLIYNYVYDHYYKIDFTQYKYSATSRGMMSPDKKHFLLVVIYKTSKSSDIAYIGGFMNSNDKDGNYITQPKTIFWQKVNSSRIKTIKIDDGETLDNWIDDVSWINSQTVHINGISLNINKKYDYRRN